MPERLTSAEPAQIVRQIYEMLRAIQRRYQQPALQVVVDLIEQRFSSPSPDSDPGPQSVSLEDVLQNWATLPEEVRTRVRQMLASEGIDVDHLLQRLEDDGRAGVGEHQAS